MIQDDANNADYSEPPSPDQTGLDAYQEARDLFYDGDYPGALAKSNLALASLTTDTTLHQFRALCLFAQQDYRNAAAAVNSVLSVGPGWDWTTMSSLYASTDTYTSQLRDLESYVEQNPKAAFAHFLLAYHYITCGYNEDAANELRMTIELEPSDTVAVNLLNILEPPAESVRSESDDESKPNVDPQQLFGSWKAAPNAATSIDLTLEESGVFEWTVNQADQSASVLSGEYSLADDKLMLQPREGGPLVGTIRTGENGFNFRIVGAPPGDEGLQFRKR